MLKEIYQEIVKQDHDTVIIHVLFLFLKRLMAGAYAGAEQTAYYTCDQ